MRIHHTGFSVCVVLVACFVASATHAQSEDVLETREVVVSSTRLPDTPVDARTLPAKVTVITAEDIQKSGAKSVQEAIQWANNIVMYDLVGNGFQQTIDLRGFNSQPVPSTSVFVDGQRINEPDFNTVNFDLIPFDTIERIEIIPGPGSIYGKNAMGGAINIITKRGGEKRQVTGEAMGGQWGRQRYTMNASGPIGKFDYYVNLAKEKEDGYRVDSSANISRVNGRVGYRPTEETDVTLSYTFVTDKLYQAGSLPLSIASVNPRANFTPGDFVDHDTNVVRLTGRQGLPWGFSLNVNGFYRDLDEQLFTVGQSSASQTISTTQSWGGTVQLTQNTPILGHKNSLVFGADMQHNKFGSNLTSPFPPIDPTFTSSNDTNENILGLYAQDMLSLLPNLILTAGVRYDQDRIDTTFASAFGAFITPPADGNRTFYRTNPRAGLTYLINPSSSLYFNYSQGFRVPTFLELFPVAGLSNPNLKPVTSDNFEIGGKVGLGNWGEASLSLFQSNVKNEIFFTCTNCDAADFINFDGLNRNVDRTRRRGVEASFKGRYNEYFDGMINYTFTDATFQSTFQSTDFITARTVMPGDTIPLVPKNRLSVAGNVHPVEGLTLTLIGLYVSSQFYLNDEANTQPRLPEYFLLNGRLAYERPVPGGRLSGFLMLNNILNQKYSTSGIMASNTFKIDPVTGGPLLDQFVVPAPTFAIYGGLSYRFEGL